MNLNHVKLLPGELARYNRQIIMPGFGLELQQKLKDAKVLVVGAGGLGCPVLLYLAAAGAGTIGIVDFDIVDESNLQRQVLFGENDVGKPKVEAAKIKLQEQNSYVNIITYNTQLTWANAMDIIKEYDVVADGSDNFAARYLVNDACVLLGKPFIYASISGFEGQLSVFNYINKQGEVGPNYRDLFATPPPQGVVPNCAEAGVLGVLPGIIGSMQASEAIKIITGIGEPLSGRLFVFDALSFETRILNFKPNENNPLNRKNFTINQLKDYDQFCGEKAIKKIIKEITVDEFINWKNNEEIQVIDVREPEEYNEVNLGAELIPLATVIKNAGIINRDKKVVIHCKTGNRSAKAIMLMEEKFGFENLYNLKGGITAYLKNVML